VAVATAAAATAGPAETLKAQVRHLQAGRYAKFYALMSPRFHAQCPYATFRREGPIERAQVAGAKLHVLRVRFAGNAAYIDYKFTRRGRELKIDGDRYVRVDGRWFDDVDSFTTC